MRHPLTDATDCDLVATALLAGAVVAGPGLVLALGVWLATLLST